MKWETNAMDSFLKDEIDDGGSLLNQDNPGPFSVIAKALHLTGVLVSVQLHLILVSIEVVHRVFRSIERFDLRHYELHGEGEVQHPGRERGFCLLHQSVHGDWSSSFYSFLHVAELLLDVSETLLP